MHIYAIGDLHLSGEPPKKPMEIFGEHWYRHKKQIKDNWLEQVTVEDTVIICGDISWAMGLKEATEDLAWIPLFLDVSCYCVAIMIIGGLA
ncbi:MAG: hypothetical protein ACLT4X_00210 [Phascolarctobacterium sp.]